MAESVAHRGILLSNIQTAGCEKNIIIIDNVCCERMEGRLYLEPIELI